HAAPRPHRERDGALTGDPVPRGSERARRASSRADRRSDGGLSMDLGLEGRTALVLASTGGLGRATAEALGREGANVVVTGRRTEAAEAVASGLPSAIGVTLDLRDARSRENAVRTAEDRFGAIDVLVVNGPGPRPQTAAALSADEAGAAFDDLVRPGIDIISRVLPGMRERQWGRVLAIGSSGIVAPLAGLVTSNLGRAALAGYLKTLAGEVAADGITGSLVGPGRSRTPRGEGRDGAGADPQGGAGACARAG